MTSFTERYKQGDRERVWSELVALGNAVRKDPIRADAEGVATETMQRVRYNIESLIPRLQAVGYQFGFGFLDQFDEEERETVKHALPTFAPPSTNTRAQIAELEAQAGPFPLSLRAFFTEVGTVNLVGGFPMGLATKQKGNDDQPVQLDLFGTALPRGLDPLFVYSSTMTLEMWRDWRDRKIRRGEPPVPYNLPIGPDYNAKYGMSGSGHYSITVPSLAPDSLLRLEWHHTTFVNYLRICFQWGGLVGLECAPNPPRDLLAYLTEGLLRI